MNQIPKKEYEYVTTLGKYWTNSRMGEADADNPVLPDGDGWRLVTMSAADGLLFWCWEREASVSQFPQ